MRPIKAPGANGRGVCCGSFSKIVSPRIGLGWTLEHEDIVDRFEMAKQMMDVCPGR